MRVWDRETSECKLIVNMDYVPICAELQENHGKNGQIVIGCYDKIVRCVDLNSMAVTKKFVGSRDHIKCI